MQRGGGAHVLQLSVDCQDEDNPADFAVILPIRTDLQWPVAVRQIYMRQALRGTAPASASRPKDWTASARRCSMFTSQIREEHLFAALLSNPDSRPLLGRLGGPDEAEAVWAEVRGARRRGGITAGEQEALAGRRLSGGQRRRLDLAIGVAGRQELLFLDEPTAGLDPHARREFHDLLGGVCRDLGTTVLMTTHDLDEAGKLADRIIILTGGRIIAQGSAEELRRQIAGEDEVRWARAGQRFRRFTPDSTPFVRSLFAADGQDIIELEVRRASSRRWY